jgi:hypothetical protein
MRYCPPYSAPNKAGCPKEDKRKKGILEENKPKRGRVQQRKQPMIGIGNRARVSCLAGMGEGSGMMEVQ